MRIILKLWAMSGMLRQYKNKIVYAKSYHVTKTCTLNTVNHPMPIFSEIHFSAEKGFSSITNGLLWLSCAKDGKENKAFALSQGQKPWCLSVQYKGRITATQRDLYLILVYGITEHPMMLLATNKPIQSKKDVVAVAKAYFPRRKIAEYFRAKNSCSSLKTLGFAS